MDDCSDILVSDTVAVAAHNEDANVALVGHTYLIKATLSDGLSCTAYTYAGELPSCAFGFNNHGLAFTLNLVPPAVSEIVAGGIGRNFISRNLLEATSIEDAVGVNGSGSTSTSYFTSALTNSSSNGTTVRHSSSSSQLSKESNLAEEISGIARSQLKIMHQLDVLNTASVIR